MKTWSILPSSRWWNKENISAKEYIEKYKYSPWQLRELAGLVDAPPLTWNTENQDVNFNVTYCNRFHKNYNFEKDECYSRIHRLALNFLFGENFVNMFPDFNADTIINGSLPFEYLHSYIVGDGLKINPGYVEKSITQSELENKLFNNIPDKKIIKENIIDFSSSSSSNYLIKRENNILNIFNDLIEDMAKETGIETTFTSLPSVTSYLLKHYSSKFLERALAFSSSSSSFQLPLSIRLFSLTARLVINELTIKLAIKLLKFVSSTSNVLFAVSLITMIPDIVLGYYNIGGFNNEITRKQIDERRKLLIDNLLKTNIEQYENTLNYIVLDDGKYISPIITPEFIYYLCLINFLKYNSDQKINICHNGLGPEEEREQIALEYLSLLKVNSIGLTIKYTDNDNDNDNDFIKSTTSKIFSHKNNNNNSIIMKGILNYNIDIYFLIICILLLIISFLFFISNPKYSFILSVLSFIFLIIWFVIFQPYLQQKTF